MRQLHRASPIAKTLVVLVYAFSCLLMAAPQTFADDLGYFESRRILSDADDALGAGRLDQAAELYARVADGIAAGRGRRARALLGAAVAELSRKGADAKAARRHLNAYLDESAADQKAMARVLVQLLDQTSRRGARAAAAPRPRSKAPSPDVRSSSEDEALIADLQKQLTAAREEIQQKEQVIEDLRKIVVEGGG